MYQVESITIFLFKTIFLVEYYLAGSTSLLTYLFLILFFFLQENHMVPELQYKLLKWLKTHVHIGNLQKTLQVMFGSFLGPKSMPDVAEGVGDVSVEESGISDTVPVKSVPPRRRTKSSVTCLRTLKDEKSCLSTDKTHEETTEGDTCLSLLVGEHSNDMPNESLPDESKKVLLPFCSALLVLKYKCSEVQHSS